MRIIALAVVAWSLSVLASPQSIPIIEDPSLEDQPRQEQTTAGEPERQPPPEELAQEPVIYHWVGADGVEVFSDEVPAEYEDQARPVDAELSILRWRE